MSRGVVGIFDSGWGGLSVAREVRSLLPAEDLLYVADHAYCPYGDRDPDEIRSRARALTRALVDFGAKAIVVACNTASSLAIDDVRRACGAVPVVGVVPAVKPAAGATESGTIAVLATPKTASGEYLGRLVRDHARGRRVVVIAAAELVGLVEAGDLGGERVEAMLRRLLGEPLRAGADQIVLGCTHFPFLRPAIERLVGPGVNVLDSGPAIARRLRHVLAEAGTAETRGVGSMRLTTTGSPAGTAPIAARLLGEPVEVVAFDVVAAGARSGRVAP